MKNAPAQIALLHAVNFIGLVIGSVAHAGNTPTLTDLALEWSRGRYVTPMICTIQGEAVRAQRRALIAPAEKKFGKTILQFRFYRMQLPSAPSDCFSALGVQEFDIDGTFLATVVGKSRADSLERDFKEMLEHKGGIDLAIQEGNLSLHTFQSPTPESVSNTKHTEQSEASDTTIPSDTSSEISNITLQAVQIKGARLSTIARTSDLARSLADYQDFPQYQLDMELSDGRLLSMPLVKTGLR